MGLFRNKQLDDLKAQFETLRGEFYQSEFQRREHDTKLSGLEAVVDGHDVTLGEAEKFIATYPKPDEILSDAAVEGIRAQLAAQAGQLARQEEQLGRQQQRLDAVEASLREFDSRVTSEIQRIQARLAELADALQSQVAELASEVAHAQQAAEQSGSPTLPAELLDGIKLAQVRLAEEQVRYDLALRAELAELAERLRKSSRT